MRFCNRCRKLTTGDPLFCAFCGSTYDVKLCSRHHPNPRYVEVCSQCGSRDMTTPHPPIPILLRPVIVLFERAPRFFLVTGIIVFVLAFVHWLLTDPAGQQAAVLLLFMAVSTVIVWRLTPPLAQRLLQGAFALFKKGLSVSLLKPKRRRE